eukprot:gb/GECG01014859.1/.p1 GENE.gb/GECG01014859.1/~~gb/GECG01014859.1/.p1  ORF type:complete len:136 (+),score=10.75 gb/GECG01014859.1/:1-408(+)
MRAFPRKSLQKAVAQWTRRSGILPLQEACSGILGSRVHSIQRCFASNTSSVGNYEQQRFIDAKSEDGVTFRAPTALDAKGMCDIVFSGTLDNNSAYAYIAFCKHFQDECIGAFLLPWFPVEIQGPFKTRWYICSG